MELYREYAFAEIAERSAALVGQYLRERRAELELVASDPVVAAAAQAADAEASRRGLTNQSPEQIERAFAATHALGDNPAAATVLRSLEQHSDFTDFLLTDSRGFTAAASRPQARFAHAGLEWWQRAFRNGSYQDLPALDGRTHTVTLRMATAVPPQSGARRVGVLSGVLGMDGIARLVASTDVRLRAQVQVVDRIGQLVGGPGIAGHGEIARVTFRVKSAGDPKLAIASLTARNGDNQAVAIAGAVGGTTIPAHSGF